MFRTQKFGTEPDEIQTLRIAYDPVTARSSQHQACDRCHEKKLKCSGEKEGCERCIVNDLSCVYTRSGNKYSRRGKRGSSKSSDSTRASSATPASASPLARDSPSPNYRRGSRSSRHPRRSPHGANSPILSSQAAGEGILGQMDFSNLSPEDGFGTKLISGSSSLGPRTALSASPTSYATVNPDQNPLLAFGGMTSQSYPQWPASTGYDPSLTTSSHLMPSYSATSGPDSQHFMSAAFSHASTYPSFQEPQDFSTYPNPNDYTNIDPRFWPPSTQPGP